MARPTGQFSPYLCRRSYARPGKVNSEVTTKQARSLSEPISTDMATIKICTAHRPTHPSVKTRVLRVCWYISHKQRVLLQAWQKFMQRTDIYLV